METREQLEEIVRLASERLGQVVTVEMVRAVQSAADEVRYGMVEILGTVREKGFVEISGHGEGG
jgi:hypothetical protein